MDEMHINRIMYLHTTQDEQHLLIRLLFLFSITREDNPSYSIFSGIFIASKCKCISSVCTVCEEVKYKV
jgi:hypothetical protein